MDTSNPSAFASMTLEELNSELETVLQDWPDPFANCSHVDWPLDLNLPPEIAARDELLITPCVSCSIRLAESVRVEERLLEDGTVVYDQVDETIDARSIGCDGNTPCQYCQLDATTECVYGEISNESYRKALLAARYLYEYATTASQLHSYYPLINRRFETYKFMINYWLQKHLLGLLEF